MFEERCDENNILYFGDDLLVGDNFIDGDEIVIDSINKSVLEYIYGQDGVVGLVYDKTKYFFRHNIQGDITRICSLDGELVSCYTYDAWGNHKVLDADGNVNTDPGFIGNINPFRYRGYYFDTETGLFYTPGRYYDPEVGRWINADDVAYLDSETIGGLNLYSYCGNDPINRYDPTGNSWESFWGGVGNWFKDNWVKLAIGAAFIIVGAAVTFFTAGMGTAGLLAAGGALLASAKAVGISMAISAGIGFAMGGLTTGTWEGALQGFGNGLADGFMWGGIFAGGAQILSGGFKIAAQLGAKTGVKGGINLAKNVKILSPNHLQHIESGGTLLKIGNLARAGKNIRLDVGVKSLLHINVQLGKNMHFFIGQYLAGIIGGF